MRQIAAGHVDRPRHHARRQDGAVERARARPRRLPEASSEVHVDAEPVQLGREIADRPVEISLPGTSRARRNWPPSSSSASNSSTAVAERGQRPRRLHAGRSAADHRDPPRRRPRRHGAQSRGPARGLTMQTRAGRDGPVDAGLVAGDARVHRPAVAGAPWRRARRRPGTAAPSRRSRRRCRAAAAPPSSMLATRLPAITGSSPTAALIACGPREERALGTSPCTVGARRLVPPDADVQRVDAAPASVDREGEDLLERRRSRP